MCGEVQRRLDALTTVIPENLAGVRVVEAFARSGYASPSFRGANDRLMARNLGAMRLSTLTMPFMLLGLNVGALAAIWLGGIQVKAGGLQVSQLVAFPNYLMQTLFVLVGISMLVRFYGPGDTCAVVRHMYTAAV
jgi:ATP-binding cassette, subfamily B, multidrug efflux pump